MTPQRYARVKSVFLQAAELKEADREPFLQRECGGDVELRAEVESLLRHDDPHTLLPDQPRGMIRNSDWRTSLERTSRFVEAVEGTMAGMLQRLLATRGRRWAVGLAMLAVLAGLGLWSHAQLRSSLLASIQSNLQSLLEAEVTALNLWINEKQIGAQTWAEHPDVVSQVEQLIRVNADSPRTAALLAAPQQGTLRETLRLHNELRGYVDFAVINQDGVLLASGRDEHVGLKLNAAGIDRIARVFDGHSMISAPQRAGTFTDGKVHILGGPIIWALAPVRGTKGDVIAALAFGIPAEAEFSRVLSVGRTGQSGETYAFDENGLLLSESRFNDQLRKIGLIPNRPDARSTLAFRLFDPGGDLTAGFDPAPTALQRRLTKLVQRAIESRRSGQREPRGVLIEPYRDYRGVSVVGAWAWLPEQGFGVATEIDTTQAFAPLRAPEVAFWIRSAGLATALLALIAAAARIVYLRQRVGSVQQLGHYTLIRKLGEGGMGIVYLAQPALLRRPAAVKLLPPSLVSPDALRRFEREVQLASQLTHPNTIEIYDYGRTDDGLLYYVMEYFPGITLTQLVERDGAVEPARSVAIVKQICGSLAEAHSKGLVHRDIKPSNIMLGEHGGLADFVKVLDFGLVKPMHPVEEADITMLSSVPGTPRYIAPERLRDTSVTDSRIDIYALGAVAYFLMTGREVFDGKDRLDVVQLTLTAEPPPPTSVCQHTIPGDLERLILDCLAKDPDQRPQTAVALVDRLDRLSVSAWTQDEAVTWWRQNADLLNAEFAPSQEDTANELSTWPSPTYAADLAK